MYKKFTVWDEEAGDYAGLETLREALNVSAGGPILIVADLGLWDGRRSAYRLINSGNLADILCGSVNGMSECLWSCDGKDIVGTERHHDGTNRYVYRAVRPGIDMDGTAFGRLLDDIYYGRPVSRERLNYCTRSVAGDFARALGSEGGEA